jgi:sugar O-acyltransferase (sialic acid O-acetyltransferase NeuD family)
LKNLVIIGYSGHSFVAIDIALNLNYQIAGYFDNDEKTLNPFDLAYLGKESDPSNIDRFLENDYFIGIGDNKIRRKICNNLSIKIEKLPTNLIHPRSIIAKSVNICENGILIMANATINPLAKIGNGAICNTGCIIEHECQIGDFAHIAPGTVLCGNVSIGENSFIGANSVVKQGIKIGKNTTIGAGSVVVKDIPDDCVAVGNPCKIIKYN